MSIIQVANSYDGKFVVQENGVNIPNMKFKTIGEAMKAAIQYKEDN